MTRDATAPAEAITTTEGLWDVREMEMKVRRLTGGIPANAKLLDAWLDANGAPPEAREAQAKTQEMLRQEGVEEHTSAFARDEQGRPCYEGRCLKAALKEAANILKEQLEIKNCRARLAEQVFVGPELVPLGSPVTVGERVIHVMTRMGPRDSIKRYESTEGPVLTFRIRILRGGIFRWTHLDTMLDYICEGGIGADRSQGSGTITSWRWI